MFWGDIHGLCFSNVYVPTNTSNHYHPFYLFSDNVLIVIVTTYSSLPTSEDSKPEETAEWNHGIRPEHLEWLDDNVIHETMELLIQARYRTRVRIEPVLKEMKMELDTFDVKDQE